MRVIDSGHTYILEGLEGYETTIDFVKDATINGTGHPGLLTQELLRVAIDRVIFLDLQVPCEENKNIIADLRDALMQFEIRAARRKIERMKYIEQYDTCPKCGHIICEHKEGR